MILRKSFTKYLRVLALSMMLPLLFSNAAVAQNSRMFPVDETFESGDFPPAEWNVYDIDGGGATWAAGIDFNHTPEGALSAYHNFGMGQNDGYLVTPAIDLPASGVMILSFWNYTVDPGYYFKHSLLISTGSGDPLDGDFIEIWTPDEVVAEWQEELFNLESYAGQTIYVAFRYEGDFADGWVVDDVYIGDDFNTSPQIAVNPTAFNVTAPINSSITKTLKVSNAGIDNLVYTTAVAYQGAADGWLTIDPQSGDIPSVSFLEHSITFSPSGLELGEYTATITLNSNDPELPELEIPVTYTIIESATIEVTIMVQDYTYPIDISENGEYAPISGFGGAENWLWSKTNGLSPIGGEEIIISGVTEAGLVAGTAKNPDYIVNGDNVLMSGFWDAQAQEWTFLDINPEIGEPFSNDYNSAWGTSADGSVVVGMQYYPNGDFKAFKWTEGVGYDMIGEVHPTGNRPNGVSNDGSVVYGFADMASTSRSPAIWTEDEFILIAPDIDGEASGASANGEYVTGYAGLQGFLWNEQTGTEFFDNSLSEGSLSPTVVMNDGTVFGFIAEGWPPFPDVRRAFARLTTGEMMTFNDYAIGRGVAEADEWLFYSINGVTPDGNKFIGGGINPDGQNVTFLLDFAAELATIVVMPESLTEALNPGSTSTQYLEIENAGNANLEWEAIITFTQNLKASGHTEVPKGKKVRPGKMNLQSKASKGGQAPIKNSRDTYILNYDGENADAVGLIAGGTMFCAARFPADMVAPFSGATLQSVDVYINDLPTSSSLLIWGAGTSEAPGAILYEQNFLADVVAWNTIVLDTPLNLDGNDIWVGCVYTQGPETYIAGVDGGPANPNGDFVSMDGISWEHLASNGLDGNLNIRAMLQLIEGNWLSLDSNAGTIAPEDSETITVTFDANELPAASYNANIIITSNDNTNPVKVIPVTMDILVDIDENHKAAIKVYPVPAVNVLNIELVEGISTVRMFNSFGQKVCELNTNEEMNISISLNDLNTGVYSLQFVGAGGKTFSKNIIVNK